MTEGTNLVATGDYLYILSGVGEEGGASMLQAWDIKNKHTSGSGTAAMLNYNKTASLYTQDPPSLEQLYKYHIDRC